MSRVFKRAGAQCAASGDKRWRIAPARLWHNNVLRLAGILIIDKQCAGLMASIIVEMATLLAVMVCDVAFFAGRASARKLGIVLHFQ